MASREGLLLDPVYGGKAFEAGGDLLFLMTGEISRPLSPALSGG
jgi:1-aminocyclopropane-1-carboxylate deaminase/D-cysteine desulfhydrase-like pyridoxal-dependent ACC family enzyme